MKNNNRFIRWPLEHTDTDAKQNGGGDILVLDDIRTAKALSTLHNELAGMAVTMTSSCRCSILAALR